jgi:hypothetical protein
MEPIMRAPHHLTVSHFRGDAASAALALVALAACAHSDSPRDQASDVSDAAAARSSVDTAPAPAFTDRIWRVAHSTAGTKGDYYVFLSDGSLLIASAHGTPSLGSWRGSGDSLTVVEEGRPYPTTVRALTVDTFAIRLTSPGAPVDLTFARAVSPDSLARSLPQPRS